MVRTGYTANMKRIRGEVVEDGSSRWSHPAVGSMQRPHMNTEAGLDRMLDWSKKVGFERRKGRRVDSGKYS